MRNAQCAPRSVLLRENTHGVRLAVPCCARTRTVCALQCRAARGYVLSRSKALPKCRRQSARLLLSNSYPLHTQGYVVMVNLVDTIAGFDRMSSFSLKKTKFLRNVIRARREAYRFGFKKRTGRGNLGAAKLGRGSAASRGISRPVGRDATAIRPGRSPHWS